ncbi:MAG: hypothetical protein KJ792_03490 [Actinobacteria bacterium]|nr:hypothetical protein [Actinomycetota bacterium]MCG2800527.1 hypothetical protein [Cellulomonas sp.]
MVLGFFVAIRWEGIQQGVAFIDAWAVSIALMAGVARAAPPAARDAPRTPCGLVSAFREYIGFHFTVGPLRQRSTELVVVIAWLLPVVLFLLLWLNAVVGIVGAATSR